MLGQRELHQDAVHGRIHVQGLDVVQEGLLADVGREFYQAGFHPRVGRGLHLVAHINLAGRVLPHNNDHQARLAAVLGLQFRHLGLDFVFHCGAQRLSVDDVSHIDSFASLRMTSGYSNAQCAMSLR